jgi:prefoldin subunit 5
MQPQPVAEARSDRETLSVVQFIDDVPAFMKVKKRVDYRRANIQSFGGLQGKSVDAVIKEFNERYAGLKMLEGQLNQRKGRLLTKLPEIQKALDMVNKLIEAEGAEMTMDFELSPHVYTRAKVKELTTVNLWLGANVMVEYQLEEARDLLKTNLENCKANLETTNLDLDLIKESTTTTEVSIARVYNYDVELRRKLKQNEEAFQESTERINK